MLDQSVILDLIDTIYGAALDQRAWADLVADLDRHLDGVALSLYGHDTQTNTSLGTITSRYSDDFLAAYQDYYAGTNPFIEPLSAAPVGVINYSEAWVPRDALLASEFYQGWLRPQEDRGAGGGGVILRDPDRLLILSGQVRFADEDEKVDTLIGTLRLLAPHIRQAFEIQRALGAAELADAAVDRVFDQIGAAVFVLTGDGRIVHANQRGETILGAGVVVRSGRTGVHFPEPAANDLFRRALAGIRDREIDGAPLTFPVAAGGEIHKVSLCPLEPGAAAPIDALFGTARRQVMLTITSPPDRVAASPLIRDLYGLTAAEFELAEALMQGRTLAEHAAGRGISRHTATNQLQAVFQKTGTNRQGALIALLCRVGT